MADRNLTQAAGGGEEAMLVERLRKIADDPKDQFAAHLHLSRLRAGNRQPRFLDIAKRAFDQLTINTQSTLFALGNCDLVLICNKVPVEQTDEPIDKVRGLFREDPLMQTAEGDMEDRFVTWYDLSSKDDYDHFYAAAEQLLAGSIAAARRAEAVQGAAVKGAPVTSVNLGEIERKLKTVRISDLIREQPAIQIASGGKAGMLFRENYVAMTDLRDRIAPGVNLFSSPWLFQYLTEVIDRKLLALLAQRETLTAKHAVSVNMNVSTVLGRDFQEFHQKIGAQASRVVIEMQVIDIFADMNAYAFARDGLQKRGYRVLVDGITPLALYFFDPGLLKADFFKITWGPEFASDTRVQLAAAGAVLAAPARIKSSWPGSTPNRRSAGA